MKTGLLVASPQLEDPWFAHAVVLLCDFSDEGAIGVIVNRATDVEAARVLEQMEITDEGGIATVVRWGGPVQPGAVFLTFVDRPFPFELRSVHSDDDTSGAELAFAVSPTMRVSPSRDVIQAVAGAKAPESFLTLGYAGWAPGQLEREIAEGSWILMEVDEDLVLHVPPDEQWERCLATLGVDQKLLWMTPVDE